MITDLGRVIGMAMVAWSLLLLVLWCWFDHQHPLVKRAAVGGDALLMAAFIYLEFVHVN